MKKKLQKILAMVLAVSMCMSLLSISALATEPESKTPSGTTSTPLGDVEVSVNEGEKSEPSVSENEGGGTTEVTQQKDTWTTSDNDEDDDSDSTVEPGTKYDVNGENTTTTTNVKDADGNLLNTNTNQTGSESVTQTNTTQNQLGDPENDVLLEDRTDDSADKLVKNEDESKGTETKEPTTDVGEGWKDVAGSEKEGTPGADTSKGNNGVTEGAYGNPSAPVPKAEKETDLNVGDPLGTKEDGNKITISFSNSGITTEGGEERQVYTSAELLVNALAGEGFTLDQNGNPVPPADTATTTYTVTKVANGYEVTKTTVTETADPKVEGEVSAPTVTPKDPTKVTVTPTLNAADQALLNGKDGTNAKGEAVKVTETGSLNENGEGTTTRTEIKEIKDASGKVIGYEITEIKTTIAKTDTKGDAGVTKEKITDAEKEALTPAAKEEDFKAPEKPASSEPVTDPETGITTTVVVTEEKDAKGNVCYKVETIKTKGDKQLSSESETIYGTYTSYSNEAIVDPQYSIKTDIKTSVETNVRYITAEEATRVVEETYTRDDTETVTEVTDTDTWNIVYVEGKEYFIYQGTLYEVVDNSGEAKSSPYGNQISYDGLTAADNDLRMYGEKGYNHRQSDSGSWGNYRNLTNKNDNYTGQVFTNGNGSDSSTNGTYKYTGYGLHSTFVLKDTSGDQHSSKMFVVKDGSVTRYVYCVELGAGLSAGEYYSNIEEIGKEDGKEGNKIWASSDKNASGTSSGTVAQLRSVALNGYWGNTDGLGSLQAVKDLLARNGHADAAAKLTEGHAIAATQAAIWEYATNGPKINDVVANSSEKNRSEGLAGENGELGDEDVILILKNLLVDLANDPMNGKAEEIGKDDLTGTFITLNSVAKDENGNVIKDASGNTKYEADLGFTLDVTTSSINGELVVKVMQGGKVVGSARLAGNGDSSGIEGGTDFGKIYPDANGTYTLPGIQLAENVTISLELSGTQHLDDGVFLYKHNSLQDFVGLSKLDKDVNLTVKMAFKTEEPEAKMTTGGSTSTRSKTNTYHMTWTDTHQEKQTETTTVESDTLDVYDSYVKNVYATVTVVETATETTEYQRDWNMDHEQVYDPPEGDDDDGDDDIIPGDDDDGDDDDDDKITIEDEIPPLSDVPAEEELFEIPDDEIPLTGDESHVAMWMMLSLFSGVGLIGLSLFGRKRKEEVDA